jgi:hypothetical protein
MKSSEREMGSAGEKQVGCCSGGATVVATTKNSIKLNILYTLFHDMQKEVNVFKLVFRINSFF